MSNLRFYRRFHRLKLKNLCRVITLARWLNIDRSSKQKSLSFIHQFASWFVSWRVRSLSEINYIARHYILGAGANQEAAVRYYRDTSDLIISNGILIIRSNASQSHYNTAAFLANYPRSRRAAWARGARLISVRRICRWIANCANHRIVFRDQRRYIDLSPPVYHHFGPSSRALARNAGPYRCKFIPLYLAVRSSSPPLLSVPPPAEEV